jgi:hypothetical protein
MKRAKLRRQPPYVAFDAFIAALDNLKLSVFNGPVDRESCGAPNPATWYHLRRTLQLLDLTDIEGTPTKHLLSLLRDRKGTLATLLSKHYPELFASDLSGFTLSRFNRVLASYGAKGGTLQRARSFFLHAAHASGIKLSPELSNAFRHRRRNNPPNAHRNVKGTVRAVTQHPEIPAGHSNFTLTLAFDLTAFSESDHELLERLTHQLVSLQWRTRRGDRVSSDPADNMKTSPEDSDDEPVH